MVSASTQISISHSKQFNFKSIYERKMREMWVIPHLLWRGDKAFLLLAQCGNIKQKQYSQIIISM